ncbi:hypothetical protein C8Q75DRAFT_803577 [Abortiporus biennis]|nr:hypothetical protein C8Q75DRAFT_803577 [Abortiporus biennis]
MPVPLPTLPPLFCSNLQHLSIRNLDDYATKILQCLHAPLKSVNITFLPDWMRPMGTEPIIYSLANFAATLEELHMSNENWPPLGGRVLTEFPRLHTLSLRNTYLYDLQHIVYAFPNLKRFTYPCDLLGHLSTLQALSPPAFEFDPPAFEFGGSRGEGVGGPGREAVMGGWEESGRRLWTSLDYLQISANALYCLALQCPVNHLDIQAHGSYINPFDQSPVGIYVTRTIVDHIRPAKLSLTLSNTIVNSIVEGRANGFYEVLAYPTLMHFSLDVSTSFTFLGHMESFIIRQPFTPLLLPLLRNLNVLT